MARFLVITGRSTVGSVVSVHTQQRIRPRSVQSSANEWSLCGGEGDEWPGVANGRPPLLSSSFKKMGMSDKGSFKMFD